MFGEYYFSATDDVKITIGLRYTDDFKEALPSNPFINVESICPAPGCTVSTACL